MGFFIDQTEYNFFKNILSKNYDNTAEGTKNKTEALSDADKLDCADG